MNECENLDENPITYKQWLYMKNILDSEIEQWLYNEYVEIFLSTCPEDYKLNYIKNRNFN